MDAHTVARCFLYAETGALVAMALRFAGSAHASAHGILRARIIALLQQKATSPDVAMVYTSACHVSGADRATVEQCVCMNALALSIVMAGSGDLDALRMLRGLLTRGKTKTGRLSYASAMAVSMAVGFLFLGGGRLSFGTSPLAVAALLMAIFPHFPATLTDNRSHLQSLRHMYVLACEDRSVEAIDVDTWEAVRCPLRVTVAPQRGGRGRGRGGEQGKEKEKEKEKEKGKGKGKGKGKKNGGQCAGRCRGRRWILSAWPSGIGVVCILWDMLSHREHAYRGLVSAF